MRELTIRTNEAGQRLDKFLVKYMPLAPKSFFYKMMRKKKYYAQRKESFRSGTSWLREIRLKLFLSNEELLINSRKQIQSCKRVSHRWRSLTYYTKTKIRSL